MNGQISALISLSVTKRQRGDGKGDGCAVMHSPIVHGWRARRRAK